MTKRRDFIKTGSILAAGSLIIPSISCNSASKETSSATAAIAEPSESKNIGVQIYSVRDQVGEDIKGALKKLADIGYSSIEGYGLGLDGKFLEKYGPAEMKKMVEDTGMEMVSTHCSYFTAEEADTMLAASKDAGLTYLIIPYLPGENRQNADDYKAVAENFNQIGEVFKGSGITFGYHNHAFEFEVVDGLVPQEILLENTEADLVSFQADLYWVTKGGYDPMKLINSYPGRFPSFHVKDANKELDQTTVGTGIVDFEKIVSARETSGLKHYFVEDERTDDPIKNLTDAYNYLNAQEWA